MVALEKMRFLFLGLKELEQQLHLLYGVYLLGLDLENLDSAGINRKVPYKHYYKSFK